MKMAGGLFRPPTRSSRRRKGGGKSEYQWQVVEDPTPDKAFHGRLFRLIDIKRGVDVGTWENGTRWRNVATGAEVAVVRGRMVRLWKI